MRAVESLHSHAQSKAELLLLQRHLHMVEKQKRVDEVLSVLSSPAPTIISSHQLLLRQFTNMSSNSSKLSLTSTLVNETHTLPKTKTDPRDSVQVAAALVDKYGLCGGFGGAPTPLPSSSKHEVNSKALKGIRTEKKQSDSYSQRKEISTDGSYQTPAQPKDANKSASAAWRRIISG